MDNYNVKEAYKRLKKENDGNRERAIAKAMDEIDDYISGSKIDDSFYKKYYDLKRLMQTINLVSPSLILGIFTGLIVSLSVSLLEKENYIGYVIIIIAGVTIAFFATVWRIASVTDCILYPYMLKRMEERLERKAKDKKAE